MKDTYSRGYKAAALVLLLIELAVLCLPVFGGSTAFLLLKGFWQHGNPLQHIAAPLLLLICLTMKTHPPTAAHFSFCPAL